MRKNNRSDTARLVTVAMFIALFIVLERFLSFNVWNMRIGFAFVALALCGMMAGPLAAGVCGALGDIIGMMLFPTGPYFPGFTLNAFLTGLVFGLFLYKKQSTARILGAVAVNQIILSLFVQTLWISITYGSPYVPLLGVRVIQCLIMIPVQIAVLHLLREPAKRIAREYFADVSKVQSAPPA